MASTSWPDRTWGNLRRAVGRMPLRVKMITALLALVGIALLVISTVSLTVFRNYQIQRANQQVLNQYQAEVDDLLSGHSTFNYPSVLSGPPYLVALIPSGTSLPAAAAQQPMVNPESLPDVPTSSSWYQANGQRLVNVNAASGIDNWRVITRQFRVTLNDGVPGQSQTVNATLIVGYDLGDINGTIRQLAGIDLTVSAIIIVGLAIVGIAIVRASLRPLTDIEQTAAAIAAGDLSRRVPEHDPATEVGRLGRALNAMLAQIEASFRAREQSEAAARRSEERIRQFVADASHELRTPLTAMRGYAEYYRQRGGVPDAAGPPPDPDAAATPTVAPEGTAPATPEGTAAGGNGQLSRADLDRIMQRVEQESARMGVLVEDMLLLARLDQQRPIERRPVDLLTLAADAVQDARIIAPDRRIELSVGSAAAFLVLGDEVRLRQVIGNLMSNALTHTPDGTPVTVRILAGPREPVPSVVLEVTDEGPGLPPDQAERVFERFYRADQARTRTAGGTGLGLAIVAALVAAHGGTVTLHTAPGQGATFRVTLPLDPEAQSDHPDDAQAAPDREGDAQAASAARAAPRTDSR
jgi:two-component system, OmpR family, sensor kinase